MWSRMDLKMCGKQAFQRNYGNSVGVALIMAIITGAMGASGGSRWNTNRTYTYSNGHGNYYSWTEGGRATGTLLSMIIALFSVGIGLAIFAFKIFAGNVLITGGCRFFVHNRTQQERMGTMLDGFKSGHYWNLVLVMFLKDLFIALWSLLLIIPGIIKAYEYRMIPYILAENPGMNREEAFLISKQMMNGEKWNVFVLDLSYIGWNLLSLFTCGLLSIFYVAPYYEATMAELYAVNLEKAYREGFVR